MRWFLQGRFGMWFHAVARAHWPVVSEPDHARWLWSRLRETFPNALAAVLMPNHLHLVGAARELGDVQEALPALASGFARHTGYTQLWEPVPIPDLLADPKHVEREVRYVALNPCRDKLAADPLAWPWSTHRDVCGAIADPWVDAPRLATALRRRREGFEKAHHAYVSGDPSVAVAGTPFPTAAMGGGRVALQRLADAAAACTRGRTADITVRGETRRAFVLLGGAHGWEVEVLAKACHVTRRTVQRDLAPHGRRC